VGRYRVILDAHQLAPDASLYWWDQSASTEPAQIKSVAPIPDDEPAEMAVEVCPCGHSLVWHNESGCCYTYNPETPRSAFEVRLTCTCQLPVDYVDADS
jgi:hypothetical protein